MELEEPREPEESLRILGDKSEPPRGASAGASGVCAVPSELTLAEVG